MIFLDNANRKLEVVLGGAKTTNDCNCVASYTDSLGFAINAISTNTTNTNGSTAVTLVAAPTGTNIQNGTLRIIKSFSVYNADTVASTVTIRYNDNATIYKILNITLQTLENLIYEDADGFTVFDTNGNIKMNIPAGSITLSGDVTGAANANTVAKINGNPLGSTTATAGNVLIGSGSQWVSNVIGTDGTLSSAGALKVLGINGSNMTLEGTSNRVFRSIFPDNTASVINVVSGTAYFVYMGKTVNSITPKFVRFGVITGGTESSVEVGLFSTPTAPSAAGQTLTKITSATVTTNLTGNASNKNTSAMSTAVSAGTFLWAGFLATWTVQPGLFSIGGDHGTGSILTLAGSGTFAGNTTFVGSTVTISGGPSIQAPDLCMTLD